MHCRVLELGGWKVFVEIEELQETSTNRIRKHLNSLGLLEFALDLPSVSSGVANGGGLEDSFSRFFLPMHFYGLLVNGWGFRWVD